MVMVFKIKTIVIVCFAALLVSGCSFNSTFTNNIEDRKDAEKVTNKLYELIKKKDYEATTVLFSKRFFDASNKEKLFEIFNATNVKLGSLEKTEIGQWETQRVEGTDPSANYALQYNNQYTNYQATETIRLTREKDGAIKIISYNINSDGFFKVN
jgi:hypothetical protein